VTSAGTSNLSYMASPYAASASLRAMVKTWQGMSCGRRDARRNAQYRRRRCVMQQRLCHDT
jgi:hypothetical protein